MEECFGKSHDKTKQIDLFNYNNSIIYYFFQFCKKIK